jgi:hypothetical protein
LSSLPNDAVLSHLRIIHTDDFSHRVLIPIRRIIRVWNEKQNKIGCEQNDNERHFFFGDFCPEMFFQMKMERRRFFLNQLQHLLKIATLRWLF